MSKPFYITTPIYYVNDEPHLGHAYTTVLADVLARYARLQGRETFFLTGTDEHGQKVQDAARRHGVDPQPYVDRMVQRFQGTWDKLDIDYDDFIRTTEPRHREVVTAVLQRLWDKGDIYFGAYEGWYCVPDERFWTEKDLVNGRCPDCTRPVEKISEGNYFFRMGNYQQWLIDHIEANPSFIQPITRRNEVMGFLQQPLGDLCISRPVERLGWGIPLPFAPAYVTYVWFDALLNYVTGAGYLSDPDRFARLWPETLHLIGKDILITHAVYWPTMLRAAGLPLPKQIFAHGWWVLAGGKMSKSRGNVVRPLDLAGVYGVDAFRYFLVRAMTPGRDAEFSEDNLAQRYESELANTLGNLVHRLVNMMGRYYDGRVPAPGAGTVGTAERDLQHECFHLVQLTLQRVENLALNEALAELITFIGNLNGYLEWRAPWKMARAGNLAEVGTTLYFAAECLRIASIMLQPVMPERTAVLWQRLGWQPPDDLRDGLVWGRLQPGSPVVAGEALFPRDIVTASP